jgi:hypothetical protein
MFLIFGAMIDGEWQDMLKFKHVRMPENNIYNIFDFPTFEVDIDFANPADIQNRLIELTEQVEAECPIGKYFGNVGVGEGIVWFAEDLDYRFADARFKVKGEKHSVSKVKKLASVDTEKLDSIKAFVDMVVTDARLNQGIEYIKSQGLDIDVKNTGAFLKWFVGDVIKEESDQMVANGLEPKDANAAVSKKAREWFFEQLNKEAGL